MESVKFGIPHVEMIATISALSERRSPGSNACISRIEPIRTELTVVIIFALGYPSDVPDNRCAALRIKMSMSLSEADSRAEK